MSNQRCRLHLAHSGGCDALDLVLCSGGAVLCRPDCRLAPLDEMAGTQSASASPIPAMPSDSFPNFAPSIGTPPSSDGTPGSTSTPPWAPRPGQRVGSAPRACGRRSPGNAVEDAEAAKKKGPGIGKGWSWTSR